MGNAAKITTGPTAIYYGVAGETPTLSLGFTTEDGVTRTKTEEVFDVKVGERLGSVKRMSLGRETEYGCTLREFDSTIYLLFEHGATTSGNVSTISSTDTDMNQISVKLVGTDPTGTPVIHQMLYATPMRTGDEKMAANALREQSVVFKSISAGDSIETITFGTGNEAVTLSSGAFARTVGQTYYKMSGESAAADTLDNITGTSLTNNELLILQIASASQPITIKHLADTLELVGEVDWVMTNVNDVLWLKYSTSGSKWVEVERYDARN